MHLFRFSDLIKTLAFWRRRPVRKQVHLNISVRRLNGEIFVAYSHDLSTGGVFIPFASVQNYSLGEYSPPFIPNDKEYVMLDFIIDGKAVNCQALVVRKSQAIGSYPSGIGLQFADLDNRVKRGIAQFIKKLPKNSPSPLAVF